jgi:hypothetical protein
MMKLFLLLGALFAFSGSAHAYEGSWFALGPSYEHMAIGTTQNGFGGAVEGGYWYLGNVSYGGYAKGSFMGKIGGIPDTNLNVYDIGVFWKAASEAGLYGKVTAGLAFISPSGPYTGMNMGNVTSLSIGFAGGFLFPFSESLQFGPEVAYRHLTAGSGADQISATALLAFSFTGN